LTRARNAYAVERMRRAGLADRVEIKLQDYRDETGHYDGIASIEMFEAVGEKYWPAYFATLRDRLKAGARATVQVITVPNERFPTYRKQVDFIQKYIFPGGMLISPGRFAEEAARQGLGWAGSIEFGESYSQTLRRWHERFLAVWDRIESLTPQAGAAAFDARFRRMWEFYLTSCAGAFHTGICDVTQITLRRPA